jgi:hypothetical protein
LLFSNISAQKLIEIELNENFIKKNSFRIEFSLWKIMNLNLNQPMPSQNSLDFINCTNIKSVWAKNKENEIFAQRVKIRFLTKLTLISKDYI